jgi:hypothetical protein
MLGIVVGLLVVGGLFVVVGAALVSNVGGAADFAMTHVTRRKLGSLAPGFAASKAGFAVYARLILFVGVFFLGAGVAVRYALVGLGVMAAALVAFVFLSVIAIRGEVSSYRALKR